MIKKNKLKLIISSVLILLPIFAGLVLWNKLPDSFPTHWNISGEVDGWGGKAFAVFGIPLILLAVNWICVFITTKDPKNKDQNGKVFSMVLWIMPLLSCITNGFIYAVALGKEIDIHPIISVMLGFMFMLIGNYIPKSKQNFTIGIRIKRTLENEENWNATHRFAGKVWFFGGILTILCAFIPENIFFYPFFILITILVFSPIIYSHIYHKKQVKEGTAKSTPIVKTKFEKRAKIVSLILISVILPLVSCILFTGNIKMQYDSETSFTIEATYMSDLTVDYSSIESIEYREDFDVGVRNVGFGSPRLSMGTFKNDEFGYYTLYSYTKCDSVIVMSIDGKILVIGGSDAENTKAIYEEIILRKQKVTE